MNRSSSRVATPGVRRFFRFATTALGAAVLIVVSASAGCDDDKTGETTRPPDATNEFTPITPDTGGSLICPSTSFTYRQEDIERFLNGEFKAPTVAPGACTAAEIDTFDKSLRTATSATPVNDVKKGLSDPCATCLFSTTAAASWQVVVAISGAEPTNWVVNFGACYASLEGTTPQTCGRTVLFDALCARAACRDCEPSATESCLQKVRASGGACFGIHEEITKACPGYLTSQPKCGTTAAQHARVLCGPVTVPDAGTDASNDAGDASDDGGDAGDAGDGG